MYMEEFEKIASMIFFGCQIKKKSMFFFELQHKKLIYKESISNQNYKWGLAYNFDALPKRNINIINS